MSPGGLASILGKGMMPNFGMRGVQSSPFTNVSQDMLSTAAAGEAIRQQISDKYDSDLDAFYDGTASLKDIFGTKEPSIEDLVPEEEKLEEDLVDYSLNEAALSNLSSDAANSALLGLFSPGGLFGKLGTASMGMNYASDFGNEYIQDVVDMADPEGTIRTVPSEEEEPFDFFGLMDFYRDAAGEDEKLNMVPNFMGTSESPYVGYEHGGRVHKGFGGTIMNNLAKIIPSQGQQQMQQTFTPNRFAYAYSPFMDAQQGFDYYTQFQAPTYPGQQVVPVPDAPGEGEDRGFSPIETLPIELDTIAGKDLGTLSGPVKGGGDNRPVSRFEANPTTMGFNDQGKVVYTNVNPYTKHVKVGDEVPFVSPLAYGLGYLADKTNKFVEKTFVPESVKAFFGKKKVNAAPMTPTKRPNITASPSGPVTPGQSMAMVGDTSLAGMSQAQAKQAMEQGFSTGYDVGKVDPGFSKALQNTSSKKSTNLGTGKFSAGNVSGYTGGPQSPHSSMSTANNQKGKKGQPKGGFTANQISKGKLVGYGFNPETGKYKGAVQTKHGPLVSDPTKNKKLQALAKKFGKNYGGGGGGGGGAGGGSGKGCFVKGTMIEMADGTEKEITTITVGELTKGGVVEAKLEFMPTQIYNYKGVEVSGSHLVMENNQFIKVEDSKRSVLTDKIEPVYCFETSDNRIWVKGIEFGDYLTGSHEQWQPHIDAMLETVNLELNAH